MTDILEGDDLVVVHEEDGAAGSSDHLLDLVLAEVPVESGTFVQAMSLVHYQAVEGIGLGTGEGAGAGKQVMDPAGLQMARQPGRVYGPRRRVLGDVARVEAPAGQGREQV